MTMNISTLRPGLLVALSTEVSGNVSYRKTDIEPEHVTLDGEKRARWETEKRVEDAREHDEAIKVRSKCRTLITGICRGSKFGLLCPEDEADKLNDRVREAQMLAEEFNSRSRLTQIGVYVICGRVAQDDVSAVQAINSEVRGLMDRMEAGLRNLDASAVREAAGKLKEIGGMLSPAAAERAQKAVAAARSAARAIVKAGEEAAIEIDTTTLKVIADSRTAFLDINMPEAEVAQPEHAGRGIDLEPVVEAVPVPRGWDVVETSTEDSETVPAAVNPPAPSFSFEI